MYVLKLEDFNPEILFLKKHFYLRKANTKISHIELDGFCFIIYVSKYIKKM